MAPRQCRQKVDRGDDARIGQDRFGQGVMLRPASAVIVGQFQKLDMQPPRQLATDVGVEEQPAAGQPARCLTRSQPMQDRAARLDTEIR